MLAVLHGDLMDVLFQNFDNMCDAQSLAHVLLLLHSSKNAHMCEAQLDTEHTVSVVDTIKSAYQRLPPWPVVSMLFDHEPKSMSGIHYYSDKVETRVVFKTSRLQNRLTVALEEVTTQIPDPHTSASHARLLATFSQTELDMMAGLMQFRKIPRKMSVELTFTVDDMDVIFGHFNTSEYDFYAFRDSKCRQSNYGSKAGCVIRKELHGTGRLAVFTFMSQTEMQYWIRRVKNENEMPTRNAHGTHQIAVPESAARFIRAHILDSFVPIWQNMKRKRKRKR